MGYFNPESNHVKRKNAAAVKDTVLTKSLIKVYLTLEAKYPSIQLVFPLPVSPWSALL